MSNPNETNPMLLLADELVEVRAELEQLEEQTKNLNERKGQIEQQLLEMMVNEEVEKFTRNGRTFYPTCRTFASIKGECKDEALAWLKENGFGDLVKEQIHPQSLSSWYKEQTEAGELPEDIAAMLSIFDKTSIGIRKGRK